MTGAQDLYVELGQYQLGSLSISQKMKGACVLLGWEVSFFFSRQYEHMKKKIKEYTMDWKQKSTILKLS